jgi:ABC-2 type transport system permease protein
MPYHLQVILACMKKEIRSALAEPRSTLTGIILPVNLLILMSLFALSGGYAPTAVVIEDHGPAAQQFYNAMAHAHSFRLQLASAQEAHDLIQEGRIVAVVAIPANFDTRVRASQPVQVNVEINNLDTDFTNDIRRAIPLSITLFYAKAFPHLVSITPSEYDWYAHDTSNLQYLAVSILVLAIMVGGLLQAGVPAAREWERNTIKELMLAPASRWAIVTGKMLGAFVTAICSILVVLALLIFVLGSSPVSWGEVIGITLLTLVIFLGWGIVLGTLIKQRQAFTVLAFGITIPLAILSGIFGPLSFFGSLPSWRNLLPQIFPVYYAIVAEQHAFHGFDLNTYGISFNVVILAAYALAMVVLATLLFRWLRVAK